MNEPTQLRGACLCGAVRYRAGGRILLTACCHCSRCRRESGSAHSVNVFLRVGELEWVAGAELQRHFTLPGTRKARAFCERCGSPVPRREGDDVVVVPAGSLDGGHALSGGVHIHCDSRADWEDGLADDPRHGALPPA